MTNNDESRLAAAIKDVIDDNSKDILKDPGRVNALLADLVPEHRKERELICRVLQEGAGTMLLAASEKPDIEQRDAVMRCIRQIKNNTYISEKAIYMAVMTIADAIDIDCRSVISEKRDIVEELIGIIDKAAETQGSSGKKGAPGPAEETLTDELWEDALRIAVNTQQISTIFLQRKLHINHNTAAKLINLMVNACVVSPLGSKEPKHATISKEELPLYLNHNNSMMGKTITYGKYHGIKIDWLVLDNICGQLLLLSKYALDFQPFNLVDKQISWESCSLRRWLNNEFYTSAFSKTEQFAIQAASLTDKVISGKDGFGGEADTRDSIFLLDDPAVYFDLPDERYLYRYCYMTEYARQKLSNLDSEYCNRVFIHRGGRVWWWLGKSGWIVDYNGNTIKNHSNLKDLCGFPFGNNSPFGAVRPAMWCNRKMTEKLSLESKIAQLNRALKSNRE